MRKIIVLSALVSLVVLSACNSQYKKADNLATLNVSFADSAWDGKTVPKDQICQWAGGNGSSPQLTVSNIPAGANAVIVEFSDHTYTPMDNGGHGKIGLWLTGKPLSVTIPSVAGQTFDLPENMFVVEQHQATNRGKDGAYLPPCSGGRGNSYYATVKAAYKAKSGKKVLKLLGQGNIEMGKY
jgi:hypothetical protein